jgi:hypothetical protein
LKLRFDEDILAFLGIKTVLGYFLKKLFPPFSPKQRVSKVGLF